MLADSVVVTMAYFLNKSHFRLIPQGMLTYGIVIHARGFHDALNCH